MSLAALRDDDGLKTLNARVLRQMRSDILTCRLMPNERLRLDALRERYQTGSSPIREALMRLEADGLVLLEQNKGFRVAPVSSEQLQELMRTRIEIEAIALRWSIENGGVEWEAELLGAMHRLSRQSKIDPDQPSDINEAWTLQHRAFHDALVSACDAPTLLAIHRNLFHQCERYVALSIAWRATPRDDVGEHEAIMRAALDRDVDGALKLSRKHIEATARKVAASDAVRSLTV